MVMTSGGAGGGDLPGRVRGMPRMVAVAISSCRGLSSRKSGSQGQIEYVPVPPPLVLDPVPVPEPLPDELENEDPLDLLPEPLLEPLEEPDVEPDPEPDPEPDADAVSPLVCAVASATPLVWFCAGRSLCVQTPSAE